MKSGLKIAIFFCSIVGIIFLINQIRISNYNKEKINVSSIRSIQPGDSLEKVVLMLGNPKEYSIETFVSHRIGCDNPKGSIEGKFKNLSKLQEAITTQFKDTISCCSPENRPHFNITITYTEPNYFFGYPMLWVHLDRNRRVYGVYIKDYSLLDDICIYSSSCNMNDSTFESIYNQQEHYENKEIFEEIFLKI